MCTTCGCNADHDHDHDHARPHRHAARRTVRIERALLAKNDRLAHANRSDAAARGVALFNLIGSPGAGKTSLLEAIIRDLGRDVPLAVIEGDQATDYDARRIQRAGCRVHQINTGTGCHLDAAMIAAGLQAMAPQRDTIVFVENVGNLVCPALFDLGERAKIVVMSVTEGEEKPLKYPHVFRAAALFVLTKIDLQPLVGLDEERCFQNAREVNPHLRTLRVSARRGDGLDELCAFVRNEGRQSGSTQP